MKTYVVFFSFLMLPLSVHAKYFFVNTIPSGAKVFLQDTQSKKKQILGKTPLKLDADKKGEIIIEKDGYHPTTNKITSLKKLQDIKVSLVPITFAVDFPNIQANFCLDKKPFTSLDGAMLLPYGSYDISFNKNKGALVINYQSPALPYVAFFGTITTVSLVMAVLGVAMGSVSFKKFQSATSEAESIKYIGQTSSWDAVMWSGIGIGSAGLIGTAISGYYEARDRKRIKRFNDLNRAETRLNPLQEYQTIILVSSDDNSIGLLNRMNDFIKKYQQSDPLWVADIMLKRAQLYIKYQDYSKAINDLEKIIKDYPTVSNYETVHKFLGDIYFQQKKYDLSYKHYEEALVISKIYPKDTLKTLMQKAQNP
ncbi:MAG: PEGA domain-containing protein [Brevinema sp.]